MIGSARLAARTDPTQDLGFTVYRNGSEIGRHQLSFSRRGELLQVDVEIQFDVTFGFIPLYRYRHRNRELWQGERLVELESTTEDDGTEHWVRAEARGDRLVVASSEGRLELPGDTTSTSYWNETSLQHGRWLDTQRGILVRSQVEAHPSESVRVGSSTVMAQRYRLAGDIDCQLWYHEGRWVKLRFEGPDGSMIDYIA